jgi:predicted amidohydrolase
LNIQTGAGPVAAALQLKSILRHSRRQESALKVAAYQAPLTSSVQDAVDLIQQQVRLGEAQGVKLLCCPEAILGGLADAIGATPQPLRRGELELTLAPLSSDTVTTVVGFTEAGPAGALYNAAAVLHRGRVVGVYRKRHPARRRSVYGPGTALPVFPLEEYTLGILLCFDSTFAEDARALAAQGARLLCIPSNNALPASVDSAAVVAESRACDTARASENGVIVVRADVAGRLCGLESRGSSAIIAPDGRVLVAAEPFQPGLVVADIPAPLVGSGVRAMRFNGKQAANTPVVREPAEPLS